MLIDFSITNYRSIQAQQTLSMAATPAFKELAAQNTLDSGLGEKSPRLLRSAVLYGPNASGKSTLIQALSFMQDRVLNSQKESQAGDEIETVPFKLNAASRRSASVFEIAFVEQGVRYEYGFSCTRQRFTEEWLFAYPLGRAQKWFHRVLDESTDQDQYKFSVSFDGERKRYDWAAQTRPNALFLSTAIQLNNAQLQPAFKWFKERLRVINPAHGLSGGYSKKKCKSASNKSRIVEFMNSAGLSLADLRVDAKIFSAEELPVDMPAAFKEELTRQMNGKEFLTLRYIHHDTETGAPIEFNEDEESDGTRALFAFAGPWLDMNENERVLVVDELDTSLHPLLVQHLVTLLHHQGTKAQLIFTTHDTTLLSQKLLRRDQVWFMEKDDTQATRLYPLSDFSPRETEAIERGYLNGRYGGIPFLKDLDFYGV
jgi:AAA15 family ATPase/GTPase